VPGTTSSTSEPATTSTSEVQDTTTEVEVPSTEAPSTTASAVAGVDQGQGPGSVNGTSTSLPRTGSDSTPLALIGGLLLAAGGSILVLRRRLTVA